MLQSLILACKTLKTVGMFYMPIVPSAVHLYGLVSFQNNISFGDNTFHTNLTTRLLAQFKLGTVTALF